MMSRSCENAFYFEESSASKVEVVPGREDYEKGHIPGSAYVDLVGELTDVNNKRFMFPMPSAEQFGETMSRHGVGQHRQTRTD